MLKIKTFTIGPLRTNCYVAYDSITKEAILIDPAVYDEDIINFIEKNLIQIKFTVNTHGHPDHIGGDQEFGYPVLIHEKDEWGLTVHRLLRDQDIIKIKNIYFKVIHLPGHTPGSIGLEYSNVIFTGDTLFCEGVGRTDLPFGNCKDLEDSLRKLLRYSDDTTIYPGHGPPSTIGHERKHNPFICESG